jgi:CBS domain-containing protein
MPTSAQVTVTTTATLLVAANIMDQTVWLHNLGGGVVYLGDANVTTANGYKMDNGDKMQVPVGDNEGLYGIVASGTHTMAILRQVN